MVETTSKEGGKHILIESRISRKRTEGVGAGNYVDNPKLSVIREIAVNDGTVRRLVMNELVVVLNDADNLLVRVSVKHLSHRGSLRKFVRVATVAYGAVGFHCTIFHSYGGNGGML